MGVNRSFVFVPSYVSERGLFWSPWVDFECSSSSDPARKSQQNKDMSEISNIMLKSYKTCWFLTKEGGGEKSPQNSQTNANETLSPIIIASTYF